MRVPIAVLFASLSCFAGTVVSTFGPADSYDTSNQWSFVGPNDTTIDYAVTFTPSADATFTAVRLALASAAQIQLEIRQGADPNGTLVESIFDTFSPGILTVNSVINPTLTAGTQYWLVARSPGLLFPSTGWFYNDQGFTGLSIETAPNVWSASVGVTPAYEILGDSAVPEPSSVILLSLAGAAFAIRNRFRS
jgi:hypothetical protein